MINTLKKIIPSPVRPYLRKLWRKIKPPQITVTTYFPKGCKFEVTTEVVKYRVTSLGEEEEFLRMLLEEIRPGDVYFDIGSCIGLHALHAALLGAKVVAFEPDPSFRRQLVRNIKINNLRRRVRVIGWAVSDKRGKATLFTDGVEGNSPSLILVGNRKSVSIETNTLDNAVIRGGLSAPTIMKMDIEGAEILAIKGMQKLLSLETAPRCIYIEFHPKHLEGFGSSIDECIGLLRSAGYTEESAQHRADQMHFTFRRH